ncbi:MAG: bifunctional phosphoribosylaminoimidazolecarboxamide formyltransferase/IMP cyclohydrolase [Candidatus Natronoplasma sp.]
MSRKALISVHDKREVVDFAEGLIENGFEIVSSGGTAAVLEDNGLEVQRVSEITGFPEILDGRVKTLHPKIHGGLLYQSGKHEEEVEEHALPEIDLVAVNLYPFEKVVEKEHTLEEAIENIDIGGVALLRAGAKNHERVTVVTEPEDYQRVLDELEEDGEVDLQTKIDLALKAFQKTASYDVAISQYIHERFNEGSLPQYYHVTAEKVRDLRYGENPNQKAAFYRTKKVDESSVLKAEQHHGKQLSYNNIVDLEAALDIVKDFKEPAVAAIKHTNPTGVASKEDLTEAYELAHDCDPMSIYGGIIGANRPIPVEMAEEIDKIFVEAVIAPGYEEGAIDVLKNKKNIRIMELPDWVKEGGGYTAQWVTEGLLVQEKNTETVTREDFEVKSEREPDEDELKAMEFGWKVIKHVKSNSILFSREDHVIGIGAGQMSRVDAVKIAKMKARSETKGATMASDAFFPFRDAIDKAEEAGIKSVIQPGGSIRDDEVIEAVDEHDMSMVFTGQRVFKH